MPLHLLHGVITVNRNTISLPLTILWLQLDGCFFLWANILYPASYQEYHIHIDLKLWVGGSFTVSLMNEV